MTPAEFRDKRLSLGLSVRKAAAYLEVAPSSVTRWEAGERGIPSEVADKLSAAGAMDRDLGEPADTDDAAQAALLGRALAVLQLIADLPELPLSVSQQFGPRALSVLSRIAHQRQNAARRREHEEALTDLLAQIGPDWLASHGVFTNDLQNSVWLGYYHQRAEQRR